MTQREMRAEMDAVIAALESRGVTFNSKEEDVRGLGDLVEEVLLKFGITEQKFQAWFGLRGCGCNKRKKYLNLLVSWRKQRG